MLVLFPKSSEYYLPRGPKGNARIGFAWFYFLFATIWIFIAVPSQVLSFWKNYKALAKHQYLTVEGLVENFDPAPEEGHKDESFTVKGVHFSFSDYAITQGYNTTVSHGGYIRPGTYVKLAYLCYPDSQNCTDPLIIRIELKK